jgi:biopolymer transport protein ExbD
MSHGGGGGQEISAEPNLVPLLDLVLQLVMFFLLVANFNTVQANKDIDLPKAQSARPVQRETDVRYLNINQNGEVLVLGRREPLKELIQIEDYLREEARLIKQKIEREGGDPNVLNTIIVIRADKRADYKPIYDIMQICRKAGFRKLQMNAMTSTGKN